MANLNDSERESYDTTPSQRMALLVGTRAATTGTTNDVESESYEETSILAKNRIII